MSGVLTTILLETLPGIIVALIGAGGFWAYLEKKQDIKRESRAKAFDAAFSNLSKIEEKVDKTSTSIAKVEERVETTGNSVEKLDKQVDELYQGQMQCATKLSKLEQIEDRFGDISNIVSSAKNTSNLSMAYARDRLNYLSNMYMKKGYIPQEDIVSFTLLGEAYIDAGGNSETKTKYLHCINKLPVEPKSLHEEN